MKLNTKFDNKVSVSSVDTALYSTTDGAIPMGVGPNMVPRRNSQGIQPFIRNSTEATLVLDSPVGYDNTVTQNLSIIGVDINNYRNTLLLLELTVWQDVSGVSVAETIDTRIVAFTNSNAGIQTSLSWGIPQAGASFTVGSPRVTAQLSAALSGSPNLDKVELTINRIQV